MVTASAAERKKQARGPCFFMRTAASGTPKVKPSPAFVARSERGPERAREVERNEDRMEKEEGEGSSG